VNVVLDASSIINLINGSVFKEILDLSDFDYSTCPLVVGECVGDYGSEVSKLLDSNRIVLLDESSVSVRTFVDLLARFNLGDGETECLCFCLTSDFTFCSDDRKARNVGESLLGSDRVTGSLGLIKRAVEDMLLTPSEAEDAYREMRRRGGFLPDVPRGFFEAG
jgi:predicted nucleic acid-binding protein